MKKILSCLVLLVSLPLLARAIITGITITLPANPDGYTANWGTGTSPFIITATAEPVSGRRDPNIEASRILVIIKKDGRKIYGVDSVVSAPAAKFNTPTKVWSGRNATALLGKDCTLPPGDYELSVQFFGDDQGKPVPLSAETIRPFTIKGNDQQSMSAIHGQTAANGVAVVTTEKGSASTGAAAPAAPSGLSEPVVTGSYTQPPDYFKQSRSTAGTKPRTYGGNGSFSSQNTNATYPAAAPTGPAQGKTDAPVFGLGMARAYQPPQALVPADDTKIAASDIKKPITFRWTPVVPKPMDAVTYRLQVFEILQGQTGPQAIKANQPIIIKDVDNLTQAIITDPLTGPGKPPHPGDFVWNVQALDRDGKPIGGNNGTSEARSFTATVHP